MANVGNIQPGKGHQFTTAHVLSLSRADMGYHVISGCDVNQAGTPGMSVVVDSGYVQAGFGTARKSVTGGSVSITAADPTNPRIDVIYIDTTGSPGVYTGTAAAISPSSKTDFKEFSTPCPGSNIPSGVILALVHVGAGVTSITNANILDIASYGPYVVESPTTTTSGKVPYWSSTAKTLSDGYSVGSTANCLVQLDGSARLPAVSGSLLTGVLLSGTKLDDLSAPDNNTDLDASTSAHGLMQKYPNTKQRLLGDASWATPIFGVNFPFGNGSAVLTAEASTKRIPIASKITKAYIRSLDTDGALKSGSITIKIYVHDYNGSIGSEVDSFVLSNASSYAETGLNSGNGWTVAAGKYITAITSSITTCEQVTLDLELEAT